MLSSLSRSWSLQFSLDNEIQKNQKKCKERAGMLPDQISLFSKISNSNASVLLEFLSCAVPQHAAGLMYCTFK